MILRYINEKEDKFNSTFEFNCDLTFFVNGSLYPNNKGFIANNLSIHCRDFEYDYDDCECCIDVQNCESEKIYESHERHIFEVYFCEYKIEILSTKGIIEKIIFYSYSDDTLSRSDYIRLIYFCLSRGKYKTPNITFPMQN